MKKIYIVAALAACLLSTTACSDFLDRDPDKILTNDQVFKDAVMIKSVLANYYGRVTWGQHVADWGAYTVIDEAAYCNGGPDHRSTFEDDRWRVYDYTLVRDINQFLKGLRETTALTDAAKAPLEGEARFLRAWYYFNVCRGLGGMPIVGDEIFDYEAGMDVTTLQRPRATEAEMYDYIISECKAIYNMLPAEKQMMILEKLAQVDIDLADEGQTELLEEAIKIENSIIEQGWESYTTYNNLAILNQKQGNLGEAEQILNEMEDRYGDDYNIEKRFAYLEIDYQEQNDIKNRDYSKFAAYYDKAEKMYYDQLKNNKTDTEMQLLENIYQQVRSGGWLE